MAQRIGGGYRSSRQIKGLRRHCSGCIGDAYGSVIPVAVGVGFAAPTSGAGANDKIRESPIRK